MRHSPSLAAFAAVLVAPPVAAQDVSPQSTPAALNRPIEPTRFGVFRM